MALMVQSRLILEDVATVALMSRMREICPQSRNGGEEIHKGGGPNQCSSLAIGEALSDPVFGDWLQSQSGRR